MKQYTGTVQQVFARTAVLPDDQVNVPYLQCNGAQVSKSGTASGGLPTPTRHLLMISWLHSGSTALQQQLQLLQPVLQPLLRPFGEPRRSWQQQQQQGSDVTGRGGSGVKVSYSSRSSYLGYSLHNEQQQQLERNPDVTAPGGGGVKGAYSSGSRYLGYSLHNHNHQQQQQEGGGGLWSFGGVGRGLSQAAGGNVAAGSSVGAGKLPPLDVKQTVQLTGPFGKEEAERIKLLVEVSGIR